MDKNIKKEYPNRSHRVKIWTYSFVFNHEFYYDGKDILKDIIKETFVDGDNKMDENIEKLRNGNINKLSVNVGNCALLLKCWMVV